MKKTKLSLSIALVAGLALSSTASAYVFVMPNDAMKSNASMEEAITDVKNSNSGVDDGTVEPEVPEEEVGIWTQFAENHGVDFDPDFSYMAQGNYSASDIPSELYPHKDPDRLDMVNKSLTNVDFLASVNTARQLDLSENYITNLNGLENLTSVAILALNYNSLSNVDGLNSLTSAMEIHLSGNNISDISGLSQLESGAIFADSYSGVKLDNSSSLCSSDSILFFGIVKAEVCL